MADPLFTPAHIQCTDADFLKSATKYRKELLRRPVVQLMKVLANIATIRPGIRYEEKIYDIDADMEFGNYDPTRKEKLDTTIGARVLRTYFGSARKQFDPNEFYRTILGSAITKGEALASVEVARLVLSIVAAKLGDKLAAHIFDAKHVDGGTTTDKLFDGWDTITKRELEAGNLAVAKKNLFVFDEAIDDTNAVDAIKEFCRAADDHLVDKSNLNLLMPRQVYYAYLDDYKATTGAIPYNTEFRKIHPEGFENISFVPMAQKRGSEFMQLTTKNNMLVGVNQTGEDEKLVVEKHDVVLLDFFATIFFGTDYESIEPDRLLVGQLKTGE